MLVASPDGRRTKFMVSEPKYALGPTDDEVVDAERAGFSAIDDGQGFWYGFENHLMGLGYEHVHAAPCSCPDDGRHGHMPECRWFRDWPASV